LIPEKYKIWFFAGGETRDNRFNLFTGSFIRLMKEIFEDDFDFIKGIFYKSNARNVIWALNHAQKPVIHPEKEKIFTTAFQQIINSATHSDHIILISSSTGSVVASQIACYLVKENIHKEFFTGPIHLVLGASMISSKSELFQTLVRYQKEGQIGIILHDEIQDEGDNSIGVGGQTKFEAYKNAFGIMFPFLSGKFKGPSFLNSHPHKGHIHRRRSKTLQKAVDYIRIILIDRRLAGEHYRDIAELKLHSINF
jgi:hypothetical protein